MEKRRFTLIKPIENVEPVDNDELKERSSRKKFIKIAIAMFVFFIVVYILDKNYIDSTAAQLRKEADLFMFPNTIETEGLADTPESTFVPVPKTAVAIEKIESPPNPPNPPKEIPIGIQPPQDTEEVVEARYNSLISEIRAMKKSGVVLETDGEAQRKILQLQTEVRKLLLLRYGPEPYKVEMTLQFPEGMPDFAENGAEGKIVIEMAPVALVPYCVFNFLEIARKWQGGAFHRWAGHVLQAMVHKNNVNSLAFQEYHKDFPHKKLTMGYAGRPGGPAFYISTVDNTENHGPASQGSKTEADGCFGRIAAGGADEAVVQRMKKQPGVQKPMGFVSGSDNFIKIPKMRIMNRDEL